MAESNVAVFKRSPYGVEFERWIKRGMKRAGIKTWEKLAEYVGVSRKTVWNWRKNPGSISKVELAGLKYILGDRDELLIDLEERFGIVSKT